MKKKSYFILLTLTKGLMAFVMLYHFLTCNKLGDLTKLPVQVIFSGITYICCQLVSRRISSSHHWWDWLYYIGLVAIMIPASFANLNWFSFALLAAQIGACILVVVVMADIFYFFKN